jgi:UDP-N-acetylmuramoyl-L-alanyl-D-glutamate--2,6-diaminopimelate ligase
MEVSSHAMTTGRVAGLRFRVAAFTNLSQDHLDFHADMEAYFQAKAALFRERMADDGVVVLPDAADAWAERLRAEHPGALLWGRSESARVRLLEEELGAEGTRLRLRIDDAESDLTSPLLGAHNVDNLLCAGACALALGHPAADVLEALPRAAAVPGRFEAVPGGGGARPVVVVDYAHTPDALAHALRTARALASGKVVVVFGCGGDRDAKKRPLMGQVAAAGADLVVLTDDNPRSEAPERIVDEIETGLPATWSRAEGAVPAPGAWARVHDRRAAIRGAIAAAGAGDLVLVAGKGHETTQTIGEQVLAFDDVEEARAALEEAA